MGVVVNWVRMSLVGGAFDCGKIGWGGVVWIQMGRSAVCRGGWGGNSRSLNLTMGALFKMRPTSNMDIMVALGSPLLYRLDSPV